MAHQLVETPTGTLTVIHFNDVYELEPQSKDPIGGISRFVHAIERVRQHAAKSGPVVTLFSGDALSPSLMSTFTKGKHMVSALNACGIQAACLGNHDLDFGVDNFESIASQHNFPWLLSNCCATHNLAPLGGCKQFDIIETGEWKIGVLGLIEREWLETLATIEASAVVFEDFADCAARLVPELRITHGCNFVVALTHMRQPNDVKLAMSAAGLDLILGGHDHDFVVSLECARGAIPLIKSGSDFREFSFISLSDHDTPAAPLPERAEDQGCRILKYKTLRVARMPVMRIEPVDITMETAVAASKQVMGKKLDAVIGVSQTPLDSIFAHVRTSETSAGNFLADIARQAVDADIAMLNSGTLRANAVLGPGIIRMKDLVALLPMQDPIVKLCVPGEVILQALENAVSKWPAQEGRFAQVSGIRFAFDPSQAPGVRVVPHSVHVLSQAVQTPVYTPATNIQEWLGEIVPRKRVTEACTPHLLPHTHVDIIMSPVVTPRKRLVRADSAPAMIHNDPVTTIAHGDSEDLSSVSAFGGSPLSETHQWSLIEPAKMYTLATKSYLAEGKDGFDCFADPRVAVLIDTEQGPILPALVRNHFRMLAHLSETYERAASDSKLLHPLSPFHCKRSKPRIAHLAAQAEPPQFDNLLHIHVPTSDCLEAPYVGVAARKTIASFAIAPIVEGRIKRI
jgi:5'-nucleotidase